MQGMLPEPRGEIQAVREQFFSGGVKAGGRRQAAAYGEQARFFEKLAERA